LRNVYDSVQFVNKDGGVNLTPCVFYQESVLELYGVKFDGTYQSIDGVAIYPGEVLDGENHWSKEMCSTEKSRSLHHYASSWWGNPKMDEAADKLRENYNLILQRMEEN
jgi:hypothetical protein